jgi:outer membrane protein assembly factor BamB
MIAALVAIAYVAQPQDGGWSGVYSDFFKSGMRGPYGHFPPPLASEPPLRSMRLVGTAPDYPVVYGGVRLESGLQSSDVRAINIRTGETYWWYHQPDKFLEDLEVDRASGDVFLTWEERETHTLDSFDRINIRTGKVHWRHNIRRSVDRAGGEEEDDPVVGGLSSGGSTVAFLTFHHAFGFSRADGSQRWALRQPKDCSWYLDPRVMETVAGTLILPQECVEKNRQIGYLVAIDIATGVQRWRTSYRGRGGTPSSPWSASELRPYVGGQIMLSTSLYLPSLVIDAATGRIAARLPGFDSPSADLSDGILISRCYTSEKTPGWCGFAANTGRLLWTQPVPESFTTGYGVLNSHGRAYVLLDQEESETSARQAHELGVLDLHTGQWIARFPLPPHRGFDGRTLDRDRPTLMRIRDGIIILHHEQGPFSLLAEPGS